MLDLSKNDQEQSAAQEEAITITPPPAESDPNTELFHWLTEKGYELFTDALSDKNPFLEKKGFVLTDRPLLVISCRKKETN